MHQHELPKMDSTRAVLSCTVVQEEWSHSIKFQVAQSITNKVQLSIKIFHTKCVLQEMTNKYQTGPRKYRIIQHTSCTVITVIAAAQPRDRLLLKHHRRQLVLSIMLLYMCHIYGSIWRSCWTMEPLSCPQQRGQDRLRQGAGGCVEEVMWVGETSVCVC